MALALVASTSQARADTEAHFPWARLGLAGGFSVAPVPHQELSGAPASKGVFAGIVGPMLDVHLDTGPVLINLEGVYNAVRGGVEWTGRGEIVLGAGLGTRTTHNLIKSISDSSPSSSGHVTRTTEYYTHKHVPFFIGLAAGASVFRVAEVSYTAPSYDVEGGVTNTRAAATLSRVDAGFKMMSPQLELSVSPLAELTTRSYGVRWVYGMALPVGDHPFFFRFSGDHVLGDDPLDNSGRRLSTVMMFALGLGTGLGAGL